MLITIEIITPQIAEEWLKRNTNNRNVRRIHWKKLSAEMAKGNWRLTGDAIRFSKDRLIDGQHRLLAVVDSGVTITSVVMRNVDDTAYNYIDTGCVLRSAADVLTGSGVEYAKACASIVTLVAAYEKGGATMHLQKNERLTHNEILERTTQRIRDAARFASLHHITGVLPVSVIGLCHYVTNYTHPEVAELFWGDVCQAGADQTFHNARLLRDRVLSHAASSKRMTVEHKTTWCARSWNAEIEGKILPTNGLKFFAGDPIPRFL